MFISPEIATFEPAFVTKVTVVFAGIVKVPLGLLDMVTVCVPPAAMVGGTLLLHV
jgi:hypothetical protein